MRSGQKMSLGNGRGVGVYTSGVYASSPYRQSVVFCHPTPGSGLYDPDPEVTLEVGARVIGVDRPGYGTSDVVTGEQWSSVGQAADDIAEVIRTLETGPVGVAGWSTGGSVALALAARHPELVTRVALIATPAPDPAVPWIPPHHRECIESLRGRPATEVHYVLAARAAASLPQDLDARMELLGQVDGPAFIELDARYRLTEMAFQAFYQGTAGLAADIAGFCLRPWGFDPAAVTAETLLLYGGLDPLARPEHGQWYAQRVPNSRYVEVDGEGHLLIISAWRLLLEYLTDSSSVDDPEWS